jgi:hypothetical protein
MLLQMVEFSSFLRINSILLYVLYIYIYVCMYVYLLISSSIDGN